MFNPELCSFLWFICLFKGKDPSLKIVYKKPSRPDKEKKDKHHKHKHKDRHREAERHHKDKHDKVDKHEKSKSFGGEFEEFLKKIKVSRLVIAGISDYWCTILRGRSTCVKYTVCSSQTMSLTKPCLDFLFTFYPLFSAGEVDASAAQGARGDEATAE